VREPDGLALSSRNRFLTPEQRRQAPLLHRTMTQAASLLETGASAAEALSSSIAALKTAGLTPDYFALVDATSLTPLDALTRPARLIAAAKLGRIRLLDNIPVG